MKTMKLFSIGSAVIVSVFSVFWVGFPLDSAKAVRNPEIDTASWGLAAGQTARLNFVNCGDGGFVIDWKVLDGRGRVLTRGAEPYIVQSGSTASFDVNGDQVNATRDSMGRIQMRAVIKGLGGPDTFDRNVNFSVEVIDNATGRSALFVSGSEVKGCSNNL